MTSLPNRAYLLCALLSVGAPFWPGVKAAAQDCTGDADCGAGYRCQTDSYESCTGEITCTPDGECTETETVTYSWCTNALCTTDADCPSTMACHAQTTWECSGMAGAGGGSAAGAGSPVDAGVSEDPTCIEVPADSVCTPRHQLPCTVASDCGGGFDCLQSTYWECTGGGSAGIGGDADGGTAPQAGAGGAGGASAPPVDADGGVAYPGDDYECHEVPIPEYYCSLQDLPCSADAECPEGLLCLNRYVWTCDGGGAAGSGTATGGAAAAGAGGGSPRPPTAPPIDADGGVDGPACELEAQQRCMPREYDGGGTPGTGGMTGGGDDGSADGGISDPGPGGFAGSGAGGAGGAGGASAPGEGSGSSDEDDDDHGHGHGLFGWLRRGCSAGGPISGDPVGWLALGLTALVLRRRARRLD
jgi:hypothetical protein